MVGPTPAPSTPPAGLAAERGRRPASGRRAELGPVVVVLAAIIAGWLIWRPPSPDLAGQIYRARLFSTAGFSIWDNAWYGGHYLPSYSVLFPPLASLLGVRPTGAVAVVLSTLLFARLARTLDGFRVRPATVVFALGATGDLFIGRIAFAVGVTCGLAAVLACVRRRRLACVVCSIACGAASPVAAAFLGLAACADLAANRTLGRAALLAGPAGCVVAGLVLLFPEGGYEPFGLDSLVAALAATAALIVLLAPADRLLRRLGWIYLASLVLAYVVRSPVGSNAVRFGILFVGPALVGRVGAADVQRVSARLGGLLAAGARRPVQVGRGAARGLLILVCAGVVLWQIDGPIDQSIGAAGDPAARQAFYVPAIDYLESRSAGRPMRIEVAFTSDHWDATILGSRFLLARGWDRQLDTRYDGLFYAARLTPAAYEAWLLDNAVSFVAVSSAQPDFSSVQEDALIRGGLPFLRLVDQTANWRIYAVRGARPLAGGPGDLVSVDADGFTLRAARAGRFTVRLHYTPYWTTTAGSASVRPAPGGWTEVDVQRPGTISVDATAGRL